MKNTAKRVLAWVLMLMLLMSSLPVSLAETDASIPEMSYDEALAAIAAGRARVEQAGSGAESESREKSEAELAEEYAAMLAQMLGSMPMEEPKRDGSKDVTDVILDTDIRITFPDGAYLYNTQNGNEYWVCPSAGLMIGLRKMENYASISTWSSVLRADGCTAFTGTINGIKTVCGSKMVSGQGYTMTYFFNYSNRSYAIMATQMTSSQQSLLVSIVGTMTMLGSTRSQQILDSGMYMNVPADMYLNSSEPDLETWHSPWCSLTMGFTRYNTANLDYWRDVLLAEGSEVTTSTINGIPVVAGLLAVGSRYYVDYFFISGSYAYSLMGALMTEAQAQKMTEVVGTLNTGSSGGSASYVLNGPAELNLSPGVVYNLADVVTVEGLGSYTLTCTSSNPSVAAVNGAQISVRGAGTAVITVGLQGSQASPLSVTVTSHEVPDEFMLPEMVETIGAEAFKNVSMEEVYICDGVTSIGSRVFAGCDELRRIYIPDSVTYISNDAFEGCTNLTVFASEDSYAHTFAEARGFDFVIAAMVGN